MTKKIDLNSAKCSQLSFESPVEFADKNGELTGFDIEAFTGAVVDRWWGKLAIEIAGITAKKQFPIFRDHNRSQIVGYSTGYQADGTFRVTGKFSQHTEHAKEVMALAKEGFPWQASIGVKPKKIISLEKGAKHTVNGKDLSGPAEVWLESEVFETSFVPLGADNKTRVTVFSEIEQGDNRAMQPENNREVLNMNLEELKRDHPELVRAIAEEAKAEATAGLDEKLEKAKEDGAASERERIVAVNAQLIPGHEALIAELAFDGKTTGPEAAVKIVAAEKELKAKAKAEFQQDAPPPVSQPSTDGQDGGQNLSAEDKAKAEWDKNADLRSEFAGSYETYLAYVKEDDGIRVKTLKNRGE